MRTTLILFGIASAVGQSSLQNSIVSALFDLTVPLNSLSAEERDTLVKLTNECETETSALSSILDDALTTVSNCSTIVSKKSTTSLFSAGDKRRSEACIHDGKSVLKKHGGLNFLAVPRLTPSNKEKLKACAQGESSAYADALMVILQRYTQCKITFNVEAKEVLLKVAPASSKNNAENSNQVAVRSICSSMDSFESINNLLVDFASNTVESFLHGLRTFDDDDERRQR